MGQELEPSTTFNSVRELVANYISPNYELTIIIGASTFSVQSSESLFEIRGQYVYTYTPI